jgi:hypothetical protein
MKTTKHTPATPLPTPMTDAEAFMLEDGQGEAVMSDFARRLECDRAQLVAALRLLIHPLAPRHAVSDAATLLRSLGEDV